MSTYDEALQTTMHARELAEAKAAAREEQREAIVLALVKFVEDFADRDRDLMLGALQAVRAAPLTATPLADTIKDLRFDLDQAGKVAAVLREELDAASATHDDLEAALAEQQDLVGFFGNVVCGMMFDIERRNAWVAEHSTCAFCGKEDLRHGDVMRAHAATCDQHPMAALRAELEMIRGERDALRAAGVELAKSFRKPK